MPRNIKITPRQYKLLCEATEDNFTFLSDDDTKPFDAQVNISTNGKVDDGTENAEKNTTTDEIGRVETPQGYNRFQHLGSNVSHMMREGVNINQADDLGELDGFDNTELNTLTNDTNDDLVKIPQGVQDKINMLLDVVKRSNLSPKQNAIVLNKLIEALNTSSTPYNMQKARDKQIQKNKYIPNQWRKELGNEAD